LGPEPELGSRLRGFHIVYRDLSISLLAKEEMDMRNTLWSLIVVVLIAAGGFALTGCGNTPSQNKGAHSACDAFEAAYADAVNKIDAVSKDDPKLGAAYVSAVIGPLRTAESSLRSLNDSAGAVQVGYARETLERAISQRSGESTETAMAAMRSLEQAKALVHTACRNAAYVAESRPTASTSTPTQNPYVNDKRQKDLAEAKQLLQAGAHPDAKGEGGRTTLMNAASDGHLELVKLMLQAKANPDLMDKDGFTAIMFAAKNNHLDVVQALLAAKADPNLIDSDQSKYYYGRTAVWLAAESGLLDMVKALLQAGANPDAKDRVGRTALMRAADNGHLEVIKALLAAKADPNLKDNGGQVALIWAKTNVEVVKALLAAKADPNAKDAEGQTVLLRIADRETPANHYTEVVKALLQAGADPNLTNDQAYRRTPLMAAAQRGNAATVSALLAAGANPNAKDSGGQTAMKVGARFPEVEKALKIGGALE
jgi:ankyrin repeat protein